LGCPRMISYRQDLSSGPARRSRSTVPGNWEERRFEFMITRRTFLKYTVDTALTWFAFTTCRVPKAIPHIPGISAIALRDTHASTSPLLWQRAARTEEAKMTTKRRPAHIDSDVWILVNKMNPWELAGQLTMFDPPIALARTGRSLEDLIAAREVSTVMGIPDLPEGFLRLQRIALENGGVPLLH